MSDNACAERHLDIKSKLPSKTFYWVTGFIIIALMGSYRYTHNVEASVHELDKDVQQVVTKKDMDKYQDAMIKAIKAIKQ